MFLKVHHSPGIADVVAVCDRELINTTLLHNGHNILLSESFYGNCAATEKEIRDALRNAGNINLMGERCVSIAIDLGLITRSGCIMIGTVPHAQIYQL